MKSKFDIYQDITDRIIAKLQQGEIPWNKPWVCSGAKVERAHRNRLPLTA